MRYFPMLLQLEGRDCLVVGGGEVAWRKAEGLVECGARVCVVAPQICDGLRDLATPNVAQGFRPDSSGAQDPALRGMVSIRERIFEDNDVSGMALAIAAVDDEAVNRRVAQACRVAGVVVNVVDVPPLCDFIVPSVIRRGDLLLAISTGGAAPSLSRKMREELEERFPDWYGEYVAKLRELRGRVMAAEEEMDKRRRIFERLTEPDVLEKIRGAGIAEGKAYMDSLVKDAMDRG